MQFTNEDIRKYQNLCRKYFNEEVDEHAAIEELNNLILMVSLIYRPHSEEQLRHVKEVKTDRPLSAAKSAARPAKASVTDL
jgi:hypothetical protein